ncbi:AAA domain-containing protein [Yinghuangia aomiensis]
MPQLLLRERSRRVFLNALRAAAEHMEHTRSGTPLLHQLVEPGVLDDTDHDPHESAATGTAPDELWFSLPYNAEQPTIAERLRHNRMVVVQGPPGTGKTHTIANLVTHLLAGGQRVLITSETARALKVLRGKLPEDVRPLCVSRAEDGATGQRELEESVKNLLERGATFDAKASAEEIARLRKQLDAARRAQAEALGHLIRLRERETYEYSAEIGDWAGTLSTIARRLARERAAHGWLGSAGSWPPPVAAADALALLAAARRVTPDVEALAADVPPAEALPAVGALRHAVESVRAADVVLARSGEDHPGNRLAALRALAPEQRATLHIQVTELVRARERLDREAATWLAPFADEVWGGRDSATRYRLRFAEEIQACLAARPAQGADVVLSGLDGWDANAAAAAAAELHQGLAAGNKPTGMFNRRTALYKSTAAFVEAALLNGRRVETADAAAHALACTETERDLCAVERELGRGTTPWSGHLRRTAGLADDVAALHRLRGARRRPWRISAR